MKKRLLPAMAIIVMTASCGPTYVVNTGGSASASPDVVAPEINRWHDLNGLCRGGSGDNPETMVRCAERDSVGRALGGMGWCHGREGEVGYQHEWHPCGPGSIGYRQ